MAGRLAGTRRVAFALEAGGQLLGNVTQADGAQLLLADGTQALPSLANKNMPSSGRYWTPASTLMSDALAGTTQSQYATSQATFLNHLQANGTLIAVANRMGSWRGLQRAGDLAPAALAAGNNNNYAGLAGYSVGRMTGDGGGTSVITGIVPDTADGDELLVINIGGANFQLGHQNANSTVGNRIICTTGVNITLSTDQMALLWYDATATRWRATKMP